MAEKKQIHLHHEGKQPPLEKCFDADLADVEAELDEWIEQSDSNIIEAQEEHIKEFRRLVCTKATIEQEILSVTEELQAAYIKSRDIFKVVLDGRANDYDEALKQLDEFKAGKDQTHVGASQEL